MVRELKKQLGMAGATFVSLPAGMYISHVAPGSRIEKAGFKAGDRIERVNKRGIAGGGLEAFYRLIEKPHADQDIENRLQHYARNTGIANPIEIGLVRGGKEMTLLCAQDAFRSHVWETEEDEIDDAIHQNRAVVLVFWADWCNACRNYIPFLEELSKLYAGRVAFAAINANANPDAMERFFVARLPTTLYFFDGALSGRFEGYKDPGELEGMLAKSGFSADYSQAGAPSTGVQMQAPMTKEQRLRMDNVLAQAIRKEATARQPAGAGSSAALPQNGAEGVCVARVFPGSAAQQAGLRSGDVLVAIDGTALRSIGEMRKSMGSLTGGVHHLRIRRENVEQDIPVALPEGQPTLGIAARPCP